MVSKPPLLFHQILPLWVNTTTGEKIKNKNVGGKLAKSFAEFYPYTCNIFEIQLKKLM